MNQRFPKSEKIKSRKIIQTIFSEGKSFTKYPIKVLFIPKDSETATQAGFSVPKRNFKHAVDRNRIKRQMIEAYRLHKNRFISDQKYMLFFIFLGKQKPDYQHLERSMKNLLKKLNSSSD